MQLFEGNLSVFLSSKQSLLGVKLGETFYGVSLGLVRIYSRKERGL